MREDKYPMKNWWILPVSGWKPWPMMKTHIKERKTVWVWQEKPGGWEAPSQGTPEVSWTTIIQNHRTLDPRILLKKKNEFSRASLPSLVHAFKFRLGYQQLWENLCPERNIEIMQWRQQPALQQPHTPSWWLLHFTHGCRVSGQPSAHQDASPL